VAINKNKVMESAQKLVEKGQLDKAIKEYLRIVQEDPKDVRIWLKVGDLYAKRNAKQEATETYLKVAEFYGEQGFYLKAVAVYKQILKLDPRLVDVNLKLAQVYRQLGLLSDAMQQYELVAAFYHREGRTREALGTIRELVDLDPENVATRIKLAELYSKEGLTQEAIGEFSTAADYLRGHGRMDDFMKVAERLVWHQPENLAINRELAGLYLKRNDPRHALQKLQVCFKADPHDVETLALLASAFLALDQKPKTVSVWKEMARIYQERGQQAQAGEVFRRVLSVAPDDPDALAVVGRRAVGSGGTGAVATPLGSPAEGRIAQPVPGAGRLTGPVVERTRQSGARRTVDDPFDASRQTGGYGRIAEPMQAVPEAEAHPTGSVPLVRTTHAFAAVVPPADLDADLSLDDDVDEPTRLPATQVGRAGGKTIDLDVELELDELSGGSIDEDSLDGGIDPAEQHADEIIKLLTETDVYIKYGLHQKAIDHLGRVFSLDGRNVEARERLKDLYLKLGREADAMTEMAKLAELTAARSPGQAVQYLAELLGLDPSDARAREIAQRFHLPLPEPTAGFGDLGELGDEDLEEYAVIATGTGLPRGASHPAPALESPAWGEEDPAIEVASGDIDIDAGGGDDTGMDLELDDIDSRGASGMGILPAAGDATSLEAPLTWEEMGIDGELVIPADPSAVDATVEGGGVDDLELPGAGDETEAVAAASTSLEDDLDEADFFVSQSMWDEAAEVLSALLARHPGNPLVLGKLQELEQARPGTAPAVEITAVEPLPVAPPAPAPKRPKVISAQPLDAADADTHYDLGLAYREMGLLDQALSELRKVVDTPGRQVQCHLMIGLIYQQQGKGGDAIAEWKQALEVAEITEREVVALCYELGLACEAGGEIHDAVFYFDQVKQRDPRFREIDRRLAGARAKASAGGGDGIMDGVLDD
jgi:pilus assembly protein FimV